MNKIDINKGEWTNRILIATPATGLVRMEWVHARYGQIIPTNWSQVELTQWINSYVPTQYLLPDAENLIAKVAIEGDLSQTLPVIPFQALSPMLSSTPSIYPYTAPEASVFQAIEIGLREDDILGFLEKESSKPVPRNVVRSITDWTSQTTFTTIEDVTLFETENEKDLEKISPRVRKGLKFHVVDKIQEAVEIAIDSKKKG